MPSSRTSNQEQQQHNQEEGQPKSGQHNEGQQTSGLGKQTSLASCSDSLRASMNREILEISQSFNTSPRPFSSQSFQLQPSSCRSLSRASPGRQNVSIKTGPKKQVSAGQESPRSTPARAHTSGTSILDRQQQQQQQQQQASTMQSQRLVHRQYNSPINLNSMDNIRKTIEAHTEDIAPGIKGINFMKPEQPINKESPVYKMIMEEKEERERRGLAVRPPTQQVDCNRPSSYGASFPCTSSAGQQQVLPAANQRSASMQPPELAAPIDPKPVRQASIMREIERQDLPVCSECGLKIVGPFAKVQSRSIHPNCFNCSTCGTSLKNTGYYTVNEKLYCEIHARLMARVLRIDYDFGQLNEPKSHVERHLLPASQKPPVASGGMQTSATASSNFNSAKSSVFTSSIQSNIERMNVEQTCQGLASNLQHVESTLKPAYESTSTANSGLSQSASARLFAYQDRLETSRHVQQMNQQQQQSVHQQHYAGSPRPQMVSKSGQREPVCVKCSRQILGPYILAGSSTWCKSCSQTSFACNSCSKSLLDCGFIEAEPGKHYCEQCYETHYAPVCSKCETTIRGDCLRALGSQWHPSCFVCGHCRQPFGNSQFYLEDKVPYCLRDWNQLFTTKCYACLLPIEAGDKFLEALDRSYHSNCFTCSTCHKELEGSLFYCKAGKPYCRLHVC